MNYYNKIFNWIKENRFKFALLSFLQFLLIGTLMGTFIFFQVQVLTTLQTSSIPLSIMDLQDVNSMNQNLEQLLPYYEALRVQVIKMVVWMSIVFLIGNSLLWTLTKKFVLSKKKFLKRFLLNIGIGIPIVLIIAMIFFTKPSLLLTVFSLLIIIMYYLTLVGFSCISLKKIFLEWKKKIVLPKSITLFAVSLALIGIIGYLTVIAMNGQSIILAFLMLFILSVMLTTLRILWLK